MSSEFKNYENFIDIKKLRASEAKTNKFVIRLELAHPLIKNFKQTNVKGRNLKKV